ncbi:MULTISPECIES: hypothetical protein [unclassified Mesorhizobium]|uniref:hypothetical protein n=1 Tax=unclassified Mesorhizobium TaxID=325217 RepID=UPI0003CF2B2B|nr:MULTISPECIES: hypothetical protein [unclassified Mesorhizobium]ESY06715.1 hypothetical protein X753_07790 [Mesorhizobium sp. LNJC399B00]WJI68630.1 hypothetical protein NLY36_28270 [Mesorhizobium sp. C399B]
MRSLILAAMAVFALPFGAAQSDDVDKTDTLWQSCPKGVLFKELESGIVVTVIRQGSGKAAFTADKKLLQPATAAELVTKEGDHGFISGPMPSYMFAVGPDTVKNFNWRPAETYPDAFYTVRDDEGVEPLLNFVDVGCAP